jgi:DNA-binding protein HU-beta
VHVNKQELIDAVATASGESKSAVSNVLDAFEDTITKEVAGGNKVAWSGFLSFERAHRAERTGRNPATGAAITVPAANVPKVKVGKKFKDAVA